MKSAQAYKKESISAHIELGHICREDITCRYLRKTEDTINRQVDAQYHGGSSYGSTTPKCMQPELHHFSPLVCVHIMLAQYWCNGMAQMCSSGDCGPLLWLEPFFNRFHTASDDCKRFRCLALLPVTQCAHAKDKEAFITARLRVGRTKAVQRPVYIKMFSFEYGAIATDSVPFLKRLH